jgi:hypothetical protein
MNLRRACLAVLILAPWLALAGALAVAYGLLDARGAWWVAAGCAALVVAVEAGVAAYRALKASPPVSRAEAVGRLQGRAWWPPTPGSGPPFGA